MGEPIDLAQKRQERSPHLTGPARCMECGHRWEAVCPIGTTRLECPNCRTHKGALIGSCYPPEGMSYWACDCGNDLFVLRPDRIMCARCGGAVLGYP